MKYAALFVVFTLLTIGAGTLIKCNDRDFPREVTHNRSMILEWTFSPSAARAIANDWKSHHAEGIAYSGLLLDTLLFIPMYVLGLLALVAWAARGELRFLPLAFCALLTGALDCIENLGSFVEVRYDLASLAPLTASVAIAKWLLGIGVLLFALRALMVKRRA